MEKKFQKVPLHKKAITVSCVLVAVMLLTLLPTMTFAATVVDNQAETAGTIVTPVITSADDDGTITGGFDILPQGDGSSSNPYKLASANDMLWFAAKVETDNSICAELTADIDMSSVCSPENGSWTPIGNYYTGTFNGNGHKISNLYINNTEADYQGLFGNPDRAIIKNTGLVDCNITGHNKVGGFVGGSSYTMVTYCYVSGTVSGNEDVGGIYGFFGVNSANYDISAATVSGTSNVGTICGRFSGSFFENSVGIKNGSLPLIGSQSGTLENVKEFADLSTGEACYFMNGDSSIKPTWYQNLGENGDAYPVLDSTHSVVYTTEGGFDCCNSHSTATDGFCSICGMFIQNEYTQDADGNIIIDTAKRLLWFSYYINNTNSANAILTSDIDISSVCGASIGNWMPIGNNSMRFCGTFNGNGHAISNLYINTTEDYQACSAISEQTVR